MRMRRVPQSVVALVSLFGVCLSLNITAPKCGGKQKVDTLLDVSRDFINRAKTMYPDCVEDDLACGQKEKSLAFLDVALNMINQVKKDYPVCPEPECPEPECPEPECPEPECPEPQLEMPVDCGEILRSGANKSGVYSIWPRRSGHSQNKSLSVYCDMDTDGGGWTVIQRRSFFSTPKDYFYKDWADYKKGFGNIEEEFWIGNDNINVISNQASYSIRFDLKDDKGETRYAVYNIFRIEDEAAQYTLRLGTYSGNAGDDMSYNRDKKFSTKDGNNICAVQRQGAWWYDGCTYANLNGLNQPGVSSNQGVIWWSWKGYVALEWVEIKLRS